jgi:hypothetical protein
MRCEPWFRPLVASLVLWSALAGCGSDGASPGPSASEGGESSGGVGVGNDSNGGSSAGKSGPGRGNAGASGEVGAAGDGQAGAPGPQPSNGNRVWLGAAIGTGKGQSHVVSVRLGGPLSGRGTALSVSVRLGKR